MSTLMQGVFSLTGLLIALGAGAAWWWARPASRSGPRFLAAATVFYTLASIYFVPFAASRVLAYGFRPFSAADAPRGPTAIVVLGSGALYTDDWDGRELVQPDLQGSVRLLEATRVYGLLPEAWMISSGGAVNASGRATTGGAMANVLTHLGVPAARIVIENRSRTTREEALFIAPILRELKISRVILVTSDFHMRRSLATFRAENIDATPAIARDPFAVRPWSEWMWPAYQTLIWSGSVFREFLAIAFYAARGWTRF